MNDNKPKRSALGTILTTVGAVIGVLAVIAYRIQLKATISPDNHQVTVIRNLISTGAMIAFGLSAALIIGGAMIGRRRRLRDQRLEAQASPELSSAAFDPSITLLDARGVQGDRSDQPE